MWGGRAAMAAAAGAAAATARRRRRSAHQAVGQRSHDHVAHLQHNQGAARTMAPVSSAATALAGERGPCCGSTRVKQSGPVRSRVQTCEGGSPVSRSRRSGHSARRGGMPWRGAAVGSEHCKDVVYPFPNATEAFTVCVFLCASPPGVDSPECLLSLATRDLRCDAQPSRHAQCADCWRGSSLAAVATM